MTSRIKEIQITFEPLENSRDIVQHRRSSGKDGHSTRLIYNFRSMIDSLCFGVIGIITLSRTQSHRPRGLRIKDRVGVDRARGSRISIDPSGRDIL